jgi:hypothetical protein
MEHGFRPLKAGKMHPNALKTLPRSASAPQVYVVLLFFSFIHVALSSATLLSPQGGTGG